MTADSILVTGAAGFIGSHYVRTLLGAGGRPAVGPAGTPRVTVLDKFTYAGSAANLQAVRDHPACTVVTGDICDAELVAEVMAGHRCVVNFAAESHVDRSITGAAEFVRTNVLGTQTLLDAALRAGVGAFVQISTDEVYGSVTTGSSSETAPLLPGSAYAASKASADLIALAHHRTHGLDVRVTRCSNNYGPHQFPEKLIPHFVTRLLRGEKVPLYGDGLHVREWLHVDDHVRGVELVRNGGRPGTTYNIGGGTELTNRELTGMILDACGAGWDRVEQVADRKGHDLRYSLDFSKITRELGYRPRQDFAVGLAETVAWYRDRPDRWERG